MTRLKTKDLFKMLLAVVMLVIAITYANGQSTDPTDYYMPAEWETQEGVWFQWSNNNSFEDVWVDMVKAVAGAEIAHILVRDATKKNNVISQLQSAGVNMANVDIQLIRTDDFWIRDNGPIFVRDNDGYVGMTDWIFNGWGGRYPSPTDDRVPIEMNKILNMEMFSPDLVLEGGAVEVNGKGTFMATRTSIINDNRNPGMSQAQIEAVLSQYLGVTHFIWLQGMSGDDPIGEMTDCHIDGSARFVDDTTVIYDWPFVVDPSDQWFVRVCKVHLQELQAATTESGKSLTLIPCPGLYLNYLVCNEVILIPKYNEPDDQAAFNIVANLHPNHTAVAIDCREIIKLGGMVHCVTQQQPAQNTTQISYDVIAPKNNNRITVKTYASGKISFRCMVAGTYRISLYNSKGKKLTQLAYRYFKKGKHRMQFPNRFFASGTYLLQIKGSYQEIVAPLRVY